MGLGVSEAVGKVLVTDSKAPLTHKPAYTHIQHPTRGVENVVGLRNQSEALEDAVWYKQYGSRNGLIRIFFAAWQPFNAKF
jgi:hypothetical protein